MSTLVDAAPVRDRVRALAEFGISPHQVTVAAGIHRVVVDRLLYGNPAAGLPPSRRIRAGSAAAIMAVPFDETCIAGGAVVDAEDIRRLLRGLVARGWSVRALAARAGIDAAHLSKVLIGRHEITAATARKVRAVHAQLRDQVPPETTKGERVSAAVARSYAARHGWEPCGPADVAVRPPAEVPAIPAPARRRRPRWHGPSFVSALAGGWDDLDPGWHPFSASPDPFERRLDEIEEEDARWFAARAAERGEVMAA